jgi:hypothetical protein
MVLPLFYSSGAVVYRKPAIEVAHHLHNLFYTLGLTNTRRFALGAILVYQLTLWYRFEHGLDLRVGLKPFLKAA